MLLRTYVYVAKSTGVENPIQHYLIRIGVLKRKISYGSKSKEGAEAYAVLLSIHTTCKLRKIPFADYLKQSLKQYIRCIIYKDNCQLLHFFKLIFNRNFIRFVRFASHVSVA